MNALVIPGVLCLLFAGRHARPYLEEYEQNRLRLIETENLQAIGGAIKLSEKESIVNEMLMKWKEKELDVSFSNPQYFNFSHHYFEYKNKMKESKVYQFIRHMPKGAVLHVHSSLMLEADYLIELTYEDHLYACLTKDDVRFQFSVDYPQQNCSVKWHLLSSLRSASNNITEFDKNLKSFFTLDSGDHIGFNTDINTVWDKFNNAYFVIKSLISYRPVREKMFYKTLQSYYDDNVLYIEIRGGLSSLYELNGTRHGKMYMAEMYDRIAKEFVKVNPDFIGIKLITTRLRTANLEQIRKDLEFARQMKKNLPDIFAGFDLVGQEDLGKPLTDFVPALLEAKDEIDYYFHGGETNWFGTPTDENMFDALLLGTRRIGHAYALVKHPTLIAAIIEKDIALEVNVISNSVLSLTQDVRNHPLATYLALGLPVVLSSDDPGAWGAKPLSDDFYVSFVGIASKHSDLRMLKQLALNSIKYSALDDDGKNLFYTIFVKRWDEFIDCVVSGLKRPEPSPCLFSQ